MEVYEARIIGWQMIEKKGLVGCINQYGLEQFLTGIHQMSPFETENSIAVAVATFLILERLVTKINSDDPESVYVEYII